MASINKVVKIVDTVADFALMGKNGLRLAPLKSPKVTVPVGKLTYAPKLKVVGAVESTGQKISAIARKEEILAKYASEKGFNLDDVTAQFQNAEKYLDEVSLEQLLKYAEKSDVKLFKNSKKKFAGVLAKYTNTNILSATNQKPIFSLLNVSMVMMSKLMQDI